MGTCIITSLFFSFFPLYFLLGLGGVAGCFCVVDTLMIDDDMHWFFFFMVGRPRGMGGIYMGIYASWIDDEAEDLVIVEGTSE